MPEDAGAPDNGKRIGELRRLLRAAANRRDAPRFLYAPPETPEDVEAALRALERPRRRGPFAAENLWWAAGVSRVHPEHTERELAARSLAGAGLTGEVRERLVAALIGVADRGARNAGGLLAVNAARGFLHSCLFWLGVSLPFLFVFSTFGEVGSVLAGLAFVVAAGLSCSPVFIGVALNQSRRHGERLRAACLEGLGRLGAVEGIGVAARAFAREAGATRAAALTALTELLPLVREEHYGRLPPGATGALCEILDCVEWRPNRASGEAGGHALSDVQVAALEALGRAGDGGAVGPVRRLAGLPPKAGPWQMFPTPEYRRLREKAAEILPVLEARRRRESESGMLLRASQAGASPDTLLRPADSSSAAPPEQLLRPSQGE